jgi:hypothetical protein
VCTCVGDVDLARSAEPALTHLGQLIVRGPNTDELAFKHSDARLEVVVTRAAPSLIRAIQW